MANYISKIFGKSPVAPMQEHMEVCYKAAHALLAFFDKVIESDWDEVARLRDQIVEYEQEADELKKQLRDIMTNIHNSCEEYGRESDDYVNYLKGANVAGFVKVADAMLAYGAM